MQAPKFLYKRYLAAIFITIKPFLFFSCGITFCSFRQYQRFRLFKIAQYMIYTLYDLFFPPVLS